MTGPDIALLAMVMFCTGLSFGLILWPYLMRFR
jgi:hypothetical protein